IKAFDGDYAFFQEDGKVLIVQDKKTNKVTLYDATTWQEIKTFDGWIAFFEKDGKLVVVMDEKENKVTLYDRATRQKIKTFDGDSAYFVKNDKMLTVHDEKANKVALYDTITWKEIKTFEGSSAYFVENDRMFQVSDKKVNKVTLYDAATWRAIKSFDGEYAFFKKDGQLLEVQSFKPHKTTIYDTTTWQAIKTFDTIFVNFDKDEKLLMVKDSKADKKITFYDTTTWQVIRTFDTDNLSFSGNMVAVPKRGEKLEFAPYNPDGIDLKSFFAFFAKGEFETTKEYEKRVRSLEMPYAISVKLAGYDADRGGFEGEVKGTKVFIPVTRDKAKDLSSHKEKIYIEGRLRYYDAGNMALFDARLVNEATNEKFAVLKSVKGTAVVSIPSPTTVYTPKQETSAAPAENIYEIPDFKAGQRLNDIAVVIGIENYRGLPKSDYSKSDAGIMKDYIKALGFQERNVTFLTDDNASLSDIKKTLETWLQNNTKKESKVFIYYSGHGAPDPKTGDAYIVPFDGDPNYLEDTGYSLRRLYEKLGKLQVAEVVVLLDSCFSGAGGRSVLAKGARPLVMMTTSTVLSSNMAVLSATQGTQISTSSPEKGHGIFTYYFLKALKDGKKNIAEIYEYIKPLVEDEAKQLNVQQSPSISPDVEKLKGRFSLRK
ncbi:MAG: caspase family protein, partial [Nitrospirota bacterium]|nr:caspase family protein [Nitrospirota bacterium]